MEISLEDVKKISTSELMEKLSTNSNGLSFEEALKRHKIYGSNEIEEMRTESFKKVI
ncbi:cation-transporting P-type ATPase [Methanobacterium spitsbergense]|uniref:cation-transporting P-type ATPase n=1 Tax=Methanobacterium spitsbergense TaxID=2874285 RepID=UPI001CBACEE5|nr:cation-transporting P-type ATPase [Methanobacterium spitsbergense]